MIRETRLPRSKREEKWTDESRSNHVTIDYDVTFSLFTITFYFQYGPVKVSTGILRYDKRVEPSNLLNCSNLKLNANNKVAMAA